MHRNFAALAKVVKLTSPIPIAYLLFSLSLPRIEKVSCNFELLSCSRVFTVGNEFRDIFPVKYYD